MTTSHQKEQAERRALSGSTTGMTYHSRAAADLALLGQGRHTQGASVTGSKPAVVYPRMPADSPWAGDLTGTEPALGYEIDAQESVGEFFEVAASSALSPDDVAVAAPEASASVCPAPSAPVPLAAEGVPFTRGRRL
jgi:hypothetical protein